MAVMGSDGGKFETILRMRDEASGTLKAFGDTAKKEFGEVGKAAVTGSDTTERAVSGLRDKLATATKAIAVASLAAGAAGVTMVRNAINTADAMNQATERTGMSAESLSAWQYKAGLAGTNAQTLNKALETMARNLSKAEGGKGSTSKALEELSLDAEELKKAGPDAAILAIADALDKVPNKMDQIRLAGDIFGKGQGSMNTVLAGGAAAFRETYAEAEKFGQIIDTKTAKAADQFNDNVEKLQKSLGGVANQVAAPLVGPLAKLSEHMVTAAKESGAFEAVARAISGVLKTVAAGLVVVGGIVGITGKAIGGTAAALAALIARDFAGAKEIMRSMGDDIANISKKSKELLNEFFKPVAYVPEDSMAGFMRKVGTMQMSGGAGGLMTVGANDGGASMDKKTRSAMGTARSALYLGLNNIEETIKSEEQRINETYERRIQIIDAAEALQLQTETDYAQLRIEVERKKEQDLTRIQTEQARIRYGATTTYNRLSLESAQFFFAQLGGLMQTKSRALFEIGKAGAVAETVFNTYRAAQGAYAALAGIPLVGPALGAAAAAAAVAVGFARVQAIRSTSFGGASGSPILSSGGTSGPVSAGDSPVVPYTAPNQGVLQQTREVHITLSGTEVYSAASIRDSLIPALNEAIGDGARILVSNA